MAKKSFKDNPALQFISAVQEEAPREEPKRALAPKPGRADERKSKRLNLLIQPSLMADLTKIARMKQVSVNALINEVLAGYRETQGKVLARYDFVFRGEEK